MGGQQQWIFGGLLQAHRRPAGQRMTPRGHQGQLVAMDRFHGQPGVAHGHGHDAEIHLPVHHVFQGAQALRAHHAQHDPRILTAKLREHLGQDIQMGRLVRTDGQLAARRALLFRDGEQDVLLPLHAILGKGLEEPARRGEGDLSAVAIEKARPHLLLEGANLCRDGRLGAEELLCGSGKALQAADFKKRPKIFEVHC